METLRLLIYTMRNRPSNIMSRQHTRELDLKQNRRHSSFFGNGFPCSFDLEDPKMFHFCGMLFQHLIHPLWDRLKKPLCGQVCDSDFHTFATSAGSFDYLTLETRSAFVSFLNSGEGVDKYDGPWQRTWFIKWVCQLFPRQRT